jgi:hypothetical protein
MNKALDNPDTFVMEDQTEWEATQVDDVFLPSVRVMIGWREVEAAVESGAIVPSEAHGLWAGWAAPGSPLRRGAMVSEQAFQATQAQELDDSQHDDLPMAASDRPAGGAMRQVMMLLLGAAVGAALMFALGR